MKLSILFLITLLLTTLSVSAQIRYGIRAGANQSTKTGNNLLDPREAIAPLSGWQLGFMADISVGSQIFVQPSLNFITKGNRLYSSVLTNTQNDGVLQYAIHPYYLEIPILIIYKQPVNESVTLYGGVGPYVAAAVGGKLFTQWNGRSGTSPLNIDLNPHYRRFDYGLTGTIGLELNRQWQVGLGYDLGLTDVNGKNSVPFSSYTRCLNLTLGFFLK